MWKIKKHSVYFLDYNDLKYFLFSCAMQTFHRINSLSFSALADLHLQSICILHGMAAGLLFLTFM